MSTQEMNQKLPLPLAEKQATADAPVFALDALPLLVVVPSRRKRVVRWLERSRFWPVLSAMLITLFVWWRVADAKVFPKFMLPSPADVWGAYVQMAHSGSLWKDIGTTLSEALLGFAIALAIGSVVGYLLSRSALLSRVLGPYIAAMQAMPMLALAPILVVWFGLGLTAKAIICAIIVFFPILVNTNVGLRSVDKDLVEAAYTQGAGRWQALWRVEIPLALRTLLGGIRVGLVMSLTGAIIGEFIASDSGLGFRMTIARTNFDSPILFAAAITMTALAIFAYVGVGWIESWLVDWD